MDLPTMNDLTGPAPLAGRRHPAQVTADRLGEALEKFADQLTPNETVAIAVAFGALNDIGEGRRA